MRCPRNAAYLQYAAMTRAEAQRRYRTYCENVIIGDILMQPNRLDDKGHPIPE
jgi:hypothetical protein